MYFCQYEMALWFLEKNNFKFIMRYILKTAFSIIGLLLTSNLFAQSQEQVEQYIEKYKKLAIDEQIRSGVPAAITLAQGIHEAAAGTSELAIEANNHFGIKCKSTWTGMTYLHDDDAKQECFRKYSSAEQSYTDHSDFLRKNNRYSALFELEMTDYIGWATELKRAGYATNPAYVKRLTDIIEKYNLQVYTAAALNKKNVVAGDVVPEKIKTPAIETVKTVKTVIKEEPKKEISNPLSETIYYKGLKGFYGKKGDMLLEKAIEYNIRYARLLQLNELEDAPLPSDMFVFTERKRRVGTVEFHQVQKGETMLLIAQKEAMGLDNLLAFNNLLEGQEPENGEQLNLLYRMAGTPKLKAKFLEPLIAKEEVNTTTQEKTELIAKVEIEKTIPVEKEIINEVVEEVKKQETAKEEDTPVLSNEDLQKMETLKNELQNQEVKTEELKTEEVKTEEVKTEEVKTEEIAAIDSPKEEEVKKTILIDENSPIIDIEKAKRIEALLSEENKVEADVVVKEVIAKETPKAEKIKATANYEDVKLTPEKVVKEVRIAPKRTYPEKNVDADTKSLKEKFDAAVYKPLPERKLKKVVPAAAVKDTVKKVVVKKEAIKPKMAENKNVKKDVPKTKGQKADNSKDKKDKPSPKTDKKKTDDKKEKSKTGKKK